MESSLAMKEDEFNLGFKKIYFSLMADILIVTLDQI
jgi:hypothetical protein